MRKGRLMTCPGHARLVVHAPIDTAGLAVADARRLAEQVRDVIAQDVTGK
jgi:hypothetical protein